MDKNLEPGQPTELRKKAEQLALASESAPDWGAFTAQDIQTLVHDLHVHQIELEMQNDELHVAHRALEEARARYFDLYNLAPVGYLVLNARGNILETNLTAARLLGAMRSDLVSYPFSRFIQPTDLVLFDQNLKRLADSTAPQSCDAAMRCKDGTRFHARLELSPGLDQEGGLAVHLVLVDTTASVHAAELLREAAEKLNKAQQLAHTGSWSWNLKTGLLEWSDEMYRIFDIPKETFTSGLWDVVAQTVHPDDRAAVERANLSMLQHGHPVSLEYRALWPDGRQRVVWAETGALSLDISGEPSVLSGTVQDITERKQVEYELEQYSHHLEELVEWRTVEAENAQRESEGLERLASVVRDANDAILVQDLTGRILAWNPMAEKMYGWSEGEALAMNIRDLVPADDRKQALGVVQQLTRGRVLEPYRITRLTRNNQIVEVWITATALLDANGDTYAIATTERAASAP